MTPDRDPLITGIGLISCLGEGEAAHLTALDAFAPVVDETSFAPYPVHPMTPLALDTQIPKRGDQRQMEAWQRFGNLSPGWSRVQATRRRRRATRRCSNAWT